MAKYFKTLDEQVELLRGRGLIIENEDKAKDKLLNYNFYKLVNGTREFFCRDDNPYVYRKGVEFRELNKLHEFDKEIKTHFLNSILDIERHLRSIISYVFMKSHPEANSYLNPDNFNGEKALITTNISTFVKTIDNYKEEENYKKSISHYSNKYKHVPFWFLINFISFGKLINFYQTMKEEEAYEVANIFTKFLTDNIEEAEGYYITVKQFESAILNIKNVRNIVAHDNLILSYKFDQDIYYIKPIHDKWEIGIEDRRNDLFNVYLVSQLFLSKSQFRELTFNIQKSLEDLDGEIDEIAYEKLIKSLGFPEEF